MYDNAEDPYQQNNLVGDPSFRKLQEKLEGQLQILLAKTGDKFLSGPELVSRCGYKVDESETVDYLDPDYYGQVSICCRDGS